MGTNPVVDIYSLHYLSKYSLMQSIFTFNINL